MAETTKVAMYTAYAVVDAQGNWHYSNEAGLLSYDNKEAAIQAMKHYGGAGVMRCRVYFDGSKEADDVTPQD